jgi:hypothetical protein
LNAYGQLAQLGPGVPLPAGKCLQSIIAYLANEDLLSLSLSAPLMPNGLPANRPTIQTQREITIANDLIGCIIGRGGQKISEIR